MTRNETTERSADAPTSPARPRSLTGAGLGVYLAIGMYFGIIEIKAEVVSWFGSKRCSDFRLSTCTGSSEAQWR